MASSESILHNFKGHSVTGSIDDSFIGMLFKLTL